MERVWSGLLPSRLALCFARPLSHTSPPCLGYFGPLGFQPLGQEGHLLLNSGDLRRGPLPFLSKGIEFVAG